MFITVHSLDRLMPPSYQLARTWPGDVRALLAGAPVAWWAGAQLGSSTGYLVSAWATEPEASDAAGREGATPARVTISPACVYRVDDVKLSTEAAQIPGVMQLVWFAGPRTDAQVRADRRADERVAAALRDLPGLGGAAIARTAQNARLVVTFADAESTLHAAFDRIMSTPLGPDEDPALLNGPSGVQICAIVEAKGTVTTLAACSASGRSREWAGDPVSCGGALR